MTLDVAPAWFFQTKYQAGITHITEPYAHPLLRANIWHLQGSDRDAFVDAGLGIASLRNSFPHFFTLAAPAAHTRAPRPRRRSLRVRRHWRW